MTTEQRGNTRVSRYLRAIFGAGIASNSEQSDAQLLERFRSGGGDDAELSFALLVERHGPMVLRTCRAILGDNHDVQDAFQAVFLVLVRKSSSLWVDDSLGPWLHAVALRVAISARESALRRRTHEQRAAERKPLHDNSDRSAELDVGPAIHEEIGRLPEAYREAVVVCDLEGLSHEEAARRLGWPVGTVKSRQARGRDKLRGRLMRRGLAPAASGIASLLAAEAASASVPARLVDSTARVAALVAQNQPATGLISTATLLLTQAVLRTMMINRIKIAASVFLLLGSVSAATAWTFQAGDAAKPPQRSVVEATKPPEKPRKTRTRTFTVEVKDVETGEPVPRVQVMVHLMDKNLRGPIESTATDFSEKVQISPPAGTEVGRVDIAARREGFVPLKIRWEPQGSSPEVPGRFVFRIERGVDIGGRVLDQEGKPIQHARVDLEFNNIDDHDSLQHFDPDGFAQNSFTDAEGRWFFLNVPRHGVRIVLAAYHPRYLPHSRPYLPEAFQPGSALREGSEIFNVEQGTLIEGTVVTPNGEPVPDATVRLHPDELSIHTWRPPVMTDQQGRFALGIKSGTVANLTVEASDGIGPIQQRLRVGDRAQKLAITMPPGRTIRGRLVDRDGKALQGQIDVSSWRGLEDIQRPIIRTDADGRFVWNDAPDDAVTFRVFSPERPTKEVSLTPGEHTIVLGETTSQ